jgi:hypothetical protein
VRAESLDLRGERALNYQRPAMATAHVKRAVFALAVASRCGPF